MKLRCIIAKDLNVRVEDGYDRLLLILAHTVSYLYCYLYCYFLIININNYLFRFDCCNC